MTKVCRDIDKLHPEVKKRALSVLEVAELAGLNVAIFETLRTEERQKELFQSKQSKTMNSYHRLGLAVDFVFKTKQGSWTWDVPNSDWDDLASIMEVNGLSSLWKRSGWDGPHAELRFPGIPTSQLYKELEQVGGDLTAFWKRSVDPRLPKEARKSDYKEPPPPLPKEEMEDFSAWSMFINSILKLFR